MHYTVPEQSTTSSLDKIRLCEIEILASELAPNRKQRWLRGLLPSGLVRPATILNETYPDFNSVTNAQNIGMFNGSQSHVEAIVSTRPMRANGTLGSSQFVSEIVDGSRGTCSPAFEVN
jgi:hypothetical protein